MTQQIMLVYHGVEHNLYLLEAEKDAGQLNT
jgi:hypothetical protein